MPRRKFNSKADKAETVNAKKKSEGKKSDAEIMAGFREELLGASIGRRIEALARASLDGFDPTKDVPMKDTLEKLEARLGKTSKTNATFDERTKYLINVVFGASEESKKEDSSEPKKISSIESSIEKIERELGIEAAGTLTDRVTAAERAVGIKTDPSKPLLQRTKNLSFKVL